MLAYLLWIFGFIGAHRFYYGRQISGVIWFFTLGLFFIGWIIDLLLIPGMSRDADRRFVPGPKDYDLTWILLTRTILGRHVHALGGNEDAARLAARSATSTRLRLAV